MLKRVKLGSNQAKISQYLNIFSNLNIKRDVYAQPIVKNVYSDEVDFLAFSGTTLSISRFISTFVTKANSSPILTSILIANLIPLTFGN